MVALRFIRRQVQVGEHLPQEQPGAMLAGDEVGVLALPSDAGPLRQGFFHDRGGVDEDLERAAVAFGHPAAQPLQAFLDQVMVVAVARVDRDGGDIPALQGRERVHLRPVVLPQHDHAARFRPERARLAALLGARLKPAHVAMVTGGKEGLQAFGCSTSQIGRREANRIEPERERLGPDFLFWIGRRHG